MMLFIFAVIGLTHILVDSEIMEPVEKWSKAWLPPRVHHGIFECHQCSGFWCGIVLGLLIVSYSVPVLFACGCAGSFLAQLGYWALSALEVAAKGKR
jgi:formate/nitrite transporter FocA (FNT family)